MPSRSARLSVARSAASTLGVDTRCSPRAKPSGAKSGCCAWGCARRWEWIGELGYATYALQAPGVVERQSGVGDGQLRLRYTAFDEAMPHAELPWPRLIVSGLVRLPLGTVAGRHSAAGLGSGGAPRGLGTWEVGAGTELQRSLLPGLELWLGGEAAYRFEDRVLGRARRLGPRLEAALGLRVLANGWLSATLSVRGRAIGEVELGGRSLPGTSERLLSVVVGLGSYDARTRVTLGLDPPVLSRGATAGVSLGLALAVGMP
jgi:hypothetical protein